MFVFNISATIFDQMNEYENNCTFDFAMIDKNKYEVQCLHEIEHSSLF